MAKAKVTNIAALRRAKAKKLPIPQQREHPINVRLKELGGRSKGYTMEWLAEQTGCSSATIRNQLAGRNQMLPSNFYQMLEVLGIGENYFYGCGPQFQTPLEIVASTQQDKVRR